MSPLPCTESIKSVVVRTVFNARVRKCTVPPERSLSDPHESGDQDGTQDFGLIVGAEREGVGRDLSTYLVVDEG